MLERVCEALDGYLALGNRCVETPAACFAFLSAWPGTGPAALGKLEDLFTHPALRRRVFATALRVHGVADCRRRGAREVVIGARPADPRSGSTRPLASVPCA